MFITKTDIEEYSQNSQTDSPNQQSADLKVPTGVLRGESEGEFGRCGGVGKGEGGLITSGPRLPGVPSSGFGIVASGVRLRVCVKSRKGDQCPRPNYIRADKVGIGETKVQPFVSGGGLSASSIAWLLIPPAPTHWEGVGADRGAS